MRPNLYWRNGHHIENVRRRVVAEVLQNPAPKDARDWLKYMLCAYYPWILRT